ncbi:MAG TPA: hypothetical protein HA362_05610 [Nanoarchaeota archaeon]|nr:hypothetical protein [Nanoarchaeota archaeon]
MKHQIIVLVLFGIFIAAQANAQYEALEGIAAESQDYNDYKACVDSCGQCESNCKANTYRRAADTQQKEEFCDYLPEAEQEMCKSGVNMANAIASKDASKCQTLADETQKNSCMMNVQTEKAVAAESEEECNVLEPAFAETCRQVFYMRMAALKSDTAYCDKVQGEGAKGVCKSGLASAVVPETNALAEETEPGNKILMLFGSIILAIILAAAVIFIALRKRKKSSGFPPLILQQQERRE